MVVHPLAPQGINTRFRGNDFIDVFLSKIFYMLYKCKAVWRFASNLLENVVALLYVWICCILCLFPMKETKILEEASTGLSVACMEAFN